MQLTNPYWRMNFIRNPGSLEEPVDELRLRRDFSGSSVARFHKYYCGIAEAGSLPDWRDIDMSELLPLAPWIALLYAEPLDDGPGFRFRFKVIGQGVAGMLGEEARNRTIDEVMPKPFSKLRHKLLNAVIENKVPAFGMREIPQDGAPKIRALFGFFPFQSVGAAPHRLVMAIQPLDEVK